MAKRSCRRTEEENRIHDKAVKLRKMTDEQLIEYIDNISEKAAQEKKKSTNIESIIEEIGNIKGIGSVKLEEIKKILEKYLN